MSETPSITLEQEMYDRCNALGRELRDLRSKIEQALHRMEQGHRPSTSITGRLLPNTADVERAAAQVDLLLNWVGSPLLPEGVALDALRAGASR